MFRRHRFISVLVRRLVGTALGAVLASGLVAAEPLKDAAAARARGDFATALILVKPLVDEEIPEAQHFLAMMYLAGEGTPQSYREAAGLLTKASEAAFAPSQMHLSAMYDQGIGVRQDFVEAARLLRLAADQGNTTAQNRLGRKYEDGHGVPQDFVKAHKWFNLSAAGETTLQGRAEPVRNRDRVAAKLTVRDLADAQAQARDWRHATADDGDAVGLKEPTPAESEIHSLKAEITEERERFRLARRAIIQNETRLRALAERAEAGEAAAAAARKETGEANAVIQTLLSQLDSVRQELTRLAAALDASESKAREQNVQIADLGKRLNAALANKVEELARYRSEFFGRLREALGNRPDIRIVGDRFVWASELLFDVGSADLGEPGREKLDTLATSLKELEGTIPRDLNWILRVDGHTDRRPIRSPLFPSNWELSTARAISVVKYLVGRGIPAERLAATGFAEHQPVEPGSGEQALARNRRIEFKLVEK